MGNYIREPMANGDKCSMCKLGRGGRGKGRKVPPAIPHSDNDKGKWYPNEGNFTELYPILPMYTTVSA